MTATEKQLTERVEHVIKQMRPFFAADGGDVKLVEITPEGVAKVQLIGTCKTCSISNMTLAGLQGAVKEAIPEIKAVEEKK